MWSASEGMVYHEVRTTFSALVMNPENKDFHDFFLFLDESELAFVVNAIAVDVFGRMNTSKVFDSLSTLASWEYGADGCCGLHAGVARHILSYV